MPDISLAEIEATTQAALLHHGAAEGPAAHVARAVAKAESVGRLEKRLRKMTLENPVG